MKKCILFIMTTLHINACEETQNTSCDVGEVIQRTIAPADCSHCKVKANIAMDAFSAFDEIEKNTAKKAAFLRKRERHEPIYQDYPPAPHTTPTARPQDLKLENEPIDDHPLTEPKT